MLAALPPWAPVFLSALRTRRRNVDLAIQAGAEACDVSVDDIASASIEDPFKEQLSIMAMEAAARSTFDAKIHVLGRAWARAF